jgi:hypothetical protein
MMLKIEMLKLTTSFLKLVLESETTEPREATYFQETCDRLVAEAVMRQNDAEV